MKHRLRTAARERRAKLTAHERQEKSRAICAHVRALPAYQRARSVLFYLPTRDEVDTRALVRDALQQKVVLLPYVEDETMRASPILGIDDIVAGPYGTWEPKSRSGIRHVDLVLVPGIAFDRARHRIGSGKGHYDRFLSGVGAIKVGLAFALQVVDSIPAKPHDVPMDIVVTEGGVL